MNSEWIFPDNWQVLVVALEDSKVALEKDPSILAGDFLACLYIIREDLARPARARAFRRSAQHELVIYTVTEARDAQ